MWGGGSIGGGLSAPPLPLQCSVSKSKELGHTFLPAGALSGAEQSRLLAYDTLGEDPSEKNCTLALTAGAVLGVTFAVVVISDGGDAEREEPAN